MSTRPSAAVSPRPGAEPADPPALRLVDEQAEPLDPAALILTCANCGAQMDERKCKLICSCGYFLSCSDYV